MNSRRKFISLFSVGAAAVATVKIAPALPFVAAEAPPAGGHILGELKTLYEMSNEILMCATSGGPDQFAGTSYLMPHTHQIMRQTAVAKLYIYDGTEFVPLASEAGAAVHNKLLRS